MNYQIIRKESLSESEYLRLIELSRKWVEEDICFGMVENSKEDIKFPIYLAIKDDEIIGYIFGHYYVKEKKNINLIDIGQKCFDVDELYVVKEYRNLGIGKALFKTLENEIKDKIDFMTLPTSNKDYQKVLKFYCEDNDMTFHSAYLVKKYK